MTHFVYFISSYPYLYSVSLVSLNNGYSHLTQVVTHKYGAEAGQLADNTMYAVGQTAMAGHNVSSLGVKGVAKKAAKATGENCQVWLMMDCFC